MSFKGIRGVCRRPHFLPLEKKKKALGKDNDKVLWDNYWNILEYCAVTNTFSLSHTAYPHFYFSFLPNKSLLPSPSQSLALTFLLILLLSSFHSFVSLFLPSFSSISPSPSLSLFPLFLSQNHTPLSVSFSISASVSLSFTPNTSLPSSLEDFDCVTVRFTWSFLKVL